MAAVAVFIVVLWSAMFEMVGASFTAFTVSTKVSLAVREPSLTVTVIVALPFWLAAGVTVTVRLAPLPPKTMFPLGTNPVLEELPLSVRLPAAVSASPTVNAIAPVGVSSLVVWSAMFEIVGAVAVM
jgi:hypothetical protein